MRGQVSESVLPARLRRLAGMEAAEVGYRLRERARCEVERAAVRLRALTGSEEGEERVLRRLPALEGEAAGSVTTYLRRVAARRFHLPADRRGREALAELVRRSFPGTLRPLSAEAERLSAHRFELLGFGEVDLGTEIDWHRDPLTGEEWERRFWADYDLVHEESAGDPKRIHELARHQHLPRLGKAYFLLGEERYALEVVRQMLGWIDQNPPGVGVHWHSSLEIALRAVSWLWALFFILPARVLDEAAARRIVASLFAQLDHVHAYPSVFSSPNTHLLGEAAALYLAGLVFPDCEGGAAWRDRGAELLAAEAERQVLPDGVHAELSTGYHAYALDFYLQALALARGHRRAERGGRGLELPRRGAEGVERRVEGMAEVLLHVLYPDGSLPRLGDGDGGRALALKETSYDAPLDLLGTAAVLFGRGDMKARAGGLREETLWLLGARGRAEWDALPEVAPGGLRAAFPAAGYFVQRSGWRTLDSQLLFDCGGLGRPSGGHGHADALSVTLATGGRELLVDPGTYVYNGRSDWRDAFRSTRAHNTVVVDGRDQSEPGDTFRWRSRAEARLLAETSFDGLDLLAGEHDGYARPPVGVVHRRRVLYVRPDYWLVLDDFRAAESGGANGAEHTFDVLYHLAPEAEIEALASAGPWEASFHVLAGDAGLLLHLQASVPLEAEVERADASRPARHLAWVSRRYGEKRPAPVVVARLSSAVPATVATLLVPYRGTAYRPAPGWHPRALPVRVRAAGSGAPDAALALALDHPGGTDVTVVAPGGPELEVGPFRMAGEAFWARLDPADGDGEGALRRLLAVGATRFEEPAAGSDRPPLLASAEPVTRYATYPARGA
jgi:hypothetical protein